MGDGLLDGLVDASLDDFQDAAAAPGGVVHGFDAFAGELAKGGIVFGEDHEVAGVEAVAERMERKAELAGGGAAAGGFWGMAAVGGDLFVGGHGR